MIQEKSLVAIMIFSNMLLRATRTVSLIISHLVIENVLSIEQIRKLYIIASSIAFYNVHETTQATSSFSPASSTGACP